MVVASFHLYFDFSVAFIYVYEMAGLPSTYVSGFHDEDLVRKMKYIPLGETGISLSKVSIGGGTLASFYG